MTNRNTLADLIDAMLNHYNDNPMIIFEQLGHDDRLAILRSYAALATPATSHEVRSNYKLVCHSFIDNWGMFGSSKIEAIKWLRTYLNSERNVTYDNDPHGEYVGLKDAKEFCEGTHALSLSATERVAIERRFNICCERMR